MSTLTTPVRARDGVLDLPLVGLGTYGLRGEAGYRSLRSALEAGYRLLDTATMYENEDEVGRAVADSGLDDVRITTKLRQQDAGREQEFCDRSLRLLRVDVLDLWLVHWPPGGQARPDVWEQLVAAQAAGRVRAVGVSNYSLDQLDELTAATGVTPAVNQVRWGPALFDAAFLEGHRQRGVVLEGYSPFKATPLDAPVLTGIARAHGVSAEQVVIRWHVQHGVIAIPKSGDPGRQARNRDVDGFALSAEEMSALDGLGR
ncbi:aldo/keto reductase [Kineococcus rhizosphaerae]|uniref:aldo/keto reductase n=1 Tax=Kineococcus rhizosphaerae TaxID=559628 RepID=UPI001B7FFDAB|nr:aldo/keto reductase [Kineococcus rhizosphaerae]